MVACSLMWTTVLGWCPAPLSQPQLAATRGSRLVSSASEAELESLLSSGSFLKVAGPREIQRLQMELWRMRALDDREDGVLRTGVAVVADPLTYAQDPPTLKHEHGRDPRYADLAADDEGILADLTARSSVRPRAASNSAFVISIQLLHDFEAAVAHAKATDRAACFKFYSPSCRSCLSVKPLYERAAARLGGSCAFYEVEANAARALCALAGIEQVPSMHIYRHGVLQDTRAINNRQLFDEALASLTLHAEGYSA